MSENEPKSLSSEPSKGPANEPKSQPDLIKPLFNDAKDQSNTAKSPASDAKQSNEPKNQPIQRLIQFVRGSPLAKNILLVVLVALFIVGFFLYSNLILEIIFNQFLAGQSMGVLIPNIVNSIILVIGTLVFLFITRFFIAKHLENKGKKKEIKLILTLYSYAVWFVTIVLILSVWFHDIGILLTSLGLIGFGLTLALQKPIMNFVGWLTIVVNKPFNIGDRIEVGGNRGDVIAIHAMFTSLQGTRVNSQEKSEQVITFPNEFILTNPVLNYTKRGDVYWDDMTLTITYESNWRKAERILLDIAGETVKRHISRPAQAVRKDRKSFEDVMQLLHEASKKLSKGVLKESIRENIETMKTIEHQASEEIPAPNVRIDLLDSSIGLNVLFVTDIRKNRVMRNEIARNFLVAVEKQHDIEFAYPHMQVLFDPRRSGVKNNSRLHEIVPSIDEMRPL